jgi:hypothetical protein
MPPQSEVNDLHPQNRRIEEISGKNGKTTLGAWTIGNVLACSPRTSRFAGRRSGGGRCAERVVEHDDWKAAGRRGVEISE